jgi:hypothetical protein
VCAGAVALVLFTACGRTGMPVALPDIASTRCVATTPLAAQASSLPALRTISAEEDSPLSGVIEHSGHGDPGAQPAIAEKGATETALVAEIRAASQIACRLRTPADAARAGYVLSANYDEGIGTHWTNWRLVDAPFDPTRPSMLLYGPRLGETQLVGFSYWVRTSSRTGPDGFAGAADKWHRHFGMCFDSTGMLERENVRSPRLCDGRFVNGTDIWMLHAWVVPGAPNVWGLFAPLNPQLCRRDVADIARCPGAES